jgi:hypothetical protein
MWLVGGDQLAANKPLHRIGTANDGSRWGHV